jgi:hypothetical protein
MRRTPFVALSPCRDEWRAARLMGITPRALSYYLAKYDLNDERGSPL